MSPHPPRPESPADLAPWLRALTLAERAEGLRAAGGPAGDPARPEVAARRLERWRAELAPSEGQLAARLAEVGLGEGELAFLLGEPPEALARRVGGRHEWLDELLGAYGTPAERGPRPWPVPPDVEPHRPLLNPVLPLLDRARARLLARCQELARRHPEAPFDPAGVVELFAAGLALQVLPLVSRTLTLELHVARLEERLEGETPEERFHSFFDALADPEEAVELWRHYPVLARQLVLQLGQWVDANHEFLERLCRDLPRLRETFFDGRDPGPLTELRGGAGDRHRGGRAVVVAGFGEGTRVVYKPRPLGIEIGFQELLGWLNERGDHPPFPTLAMLDRGDYGWVEWVSAGPCSTDGEVERFYTRQGGYLALLHVLAATDFHQENLIACGEQPVLVDLESIFHPGVEGRRWGGTDRGSLDVFDHSVLRVGLLPQRMRMRDGVEGIDLSGIGSLEGQRSPTYFAYLEGVGSDEMRIARGRFDLADADHRPATAGGKADPRRFEKELLGGFVSVYRTLAGHRAELLADDGPLARFAELESRAILRPTLAYLRLLQESFHPTLLRDALDRDRFFDRLRSRVDDRPAFAPVVGREQEELWRGDVPLFTTRPGSRDLWTSRGERIPGVFEESGLEVARRRLEKLGEDDLRRQLWFVEASLATLTVDPGELERSGYTPRPPAAPATRQRLLAAARAVGERLEELAIPGDGEEVAWVGIGLRGATEWTIEPVAGDLYGGISGIAFFLAYLGEVAGEARLTELARRGFATVEGWLDEGRPIFDTPGGFGGWSSFFYAAAHLGALWGDDALLERTATRLADFEPTIETTPETDVVGGLAGCAAALLAFHRTTGSAAALAAAERCVERLVAVAEPAEGGVGWPSEEREWPAMAGFSHGNAGTAWALLAVAAASGRPEPWKRQLRETALAALAHERTLFSERWKNWADLRGFAREEWAKYSTVAWCHGAVGVAMGRLGVLPWLDDAEVRREIDAALDTTVERGFGRSHCLCHGDLSAIEALAEAGRRLGEERHRREAERRAAALLESIEQDGWFCGVPTGIETPGLLIGLAGIGYGLLRLADPDRIPSVLLLEPPATAGG